MYSVYGCRRAYRELIDIDKGLNGLGDKIETKLNKDKKDDSSEMVSISQGFVSASLLFFVGAMAVVGSLNSGLFGNNDTLFAKSALDGVSAFLFSLTMGIGVLLSGIAVFYIRRDYSKVGHFTKGNIVNCCNNRDECCWELAYIGTWYKHAIKTRYKSCKPTSSNVCADNIWSIGSNIEFIL